MQKEKTVKEISVERGEYMRPVAEAEKTTKEIKQFVKSVKKINESHEWRIFVAGGARAGNDPIYEQEAYRLGEEIGKKHFRLFFGLAGVGIMGAVAKGVLKNWMEENDEKASPIKGITTELYMSFNTEADEEIVKQVKEILVAHTLEERKNGLLAADFVVFAPGGLGTLDELAYDCVAMQDGFLPLKPIIIFNVNGYFHHILEYLKEIAQKGFARTVPFIVVDDAYEAGIAFEILKNIFPGTKTREEVEEKLERIIYEMPFVLEQKSLTPQRPVADILQEIEIMKDDERFAASIEKAYLHKEIERMYGRLEKTSQDTAAVSEKLTQLKNRRKKDSDGIY
ncbi:MAG: LOG family protein [Alphaproteobacteria bacterium]